MKEGEWRSVALGANGGAYYLLVLSAVILLFGTLLFLGWMLLLDPLPPVGILVIVGICGLVMLHQAFEVSKYALILARTAKNVVIRNGEVGLVLFTNRAIPLSYFSISRNKAEKYLKRKESKLFPKECDIGVINQERQNYYIPSDIQDFDLVYDTLEEFAVRNER